MDTLSIIETIIRLGFDMRVRRVKTVRNAVDVTLVVVEIGTEISGEGLTPTEAFKAALVNLQAKAKQRHTSDSAVLALVLEPPLVTDPIV